MRTDYKFIIISFLAYCIENILIKRIINIVNNIILIMKKNIFFIVFIVLFLSGCSLGYKVYPYRDITEEEIQHFIPYGYDVIKDEIYKSPNIIKLNFIKNKYNDKNIALLLTPKNSDIYNESQNPKLEILGFNRRSDKWEMLGDVYNIKGTAISGPYEITDLNNDGLNELHITATLSCGSSCSYHQYVFSYNNESINDMFDEDIYSIQGFRFLSDKKEYLNINYIWNDGESHFGCHYFEVSKYLFNYKTNKFELLDKIKSKEKYELGDGFGQCKPYSEGDLIRNIGLFD